MEVVYLSHILKKDIPVYGNKKAALDIEQRKSITKGDSCNTYRFSMENHWGTHIEAPAHFFVNGKKVSDQPADYWIFNAPCVVKIDPDKDAVIGLDEIKSMVRGGHDILLLQTGFGRLRGSDVYSCGNPIVSPEIGKWLREKRPDIRAIGLDLISIGSVRNRELSRASHREFLDPAKNGHPIFIIEDMNLSIDMSDLKTVIAVPILIDAMDSAPCTVLGIFEKK